MKMQGYNGSQAPSRRPAAPPLARARAARALTAGGARAGQAWDTSFAMQAVLEAGLGDAFPEFSTRVHRYLERSQILSTPASQASSAFPYESVEMRLKYFRHVSKGGWPFSTSAHGWPIADCTAEGLKAVLGLQHLACVRAAGQPLVTPPRLHDAVHVLLTYQNADGGWATYENNRGYRFYEWLNPCETFGDIMIDYSYVELSSASMTALAAFQRDHPAVRPRPARPRPVPRRRAEAPPRARQHRREEIAAALARGARFVRTIQRADGSWYPPPPLPTVTPTLTDAWRQVRLMGGLLHVRDVVRDRGAARRGRARLARSAPRGGVSAREAGKQPCPPPATISPTLNPTVPVEAGELRRVGRNHPLLPRQKLRRHPGPPAPAPRACPRPAPARARARGAHRAPRRADAGREGKDTFNDKRGGGRRRRSGRGRAGWCKRRGRCWR
jgi:hypothetical protein